MRKKAGKYTRAPRKSGIREVKVRIDRILQVVTDFYGVSKEDMIDKKKMGKGLEMSRIRAILCYKFKKDLDMGPTEIGEIMNMTVQGVVFALERIGKDPEMIQEFKNIIGED